MPILNSEMIETFRSLQTPDDPHFLKKLLDSFLSSLPQHLATLKKAAQDNDAKSLAHGAHAIKSAAMNLDLAAIVETCQRLEKNGDQGQLDGSVELVTTLDGQLKQAEQEIYALPEYK